MSILKLQGENEFKVGVVTKHLEKFFFVKITEKAGAYPNMETDGEVIVHRDVFEAWNSKANYNTDLHNGVEILVGGLVETQLGIKATKVSLIKKANPSPREDEDSEELLHEGVVQAVKGILKVVKAIKRYNRATN